MRFDIYFNDEEGNLSDLGAVSSVSECLALTKSNSFKYTLLKDGICFGSNYESLKPSDDCNLQCTSGEECGGASSYSVYSEGINTYALQKD